MVRLQAVLNTSVLGPGSTFPPVLEQWPHTILLCRKRKEVRDSGAFLSLSNQHACLGKSCESALGCEVDVKMRKVFTSCHSQREYNLCIKE